MAILLWWYWKIKMKKINTENVKITAAGFKPMQGTKAHGMGFEFEKSPTLIGGGAQVY